MNKKNIILIILLSSLLLQASWVGAAPILVRFEGAPTQTGGDPGDYVNSIYTWSLGVAALLALLMLVVGGISYTLSAGSIVNRERAVGIIKNALVGLLLLLSVALILTTINPNLLKIGLTDIAEKTAALTGEKIKEVTQTALAEALSYNYLGVALVQNTDDLENRSSELSRMVKNFNYLRKDALRPPNDRYAINLTRSNLVTAVQHFNSSFDEYFASSEFETNLEAGVKSDGTSFWVYVIPGYGGVRLLADAYNYITGADKDELRAKVVYTAYRDFMDATDLMQIPEVSGIISSKLKTLAAAL